MPSAPLVMAFQLSAVSRKISATAMEASTKYGPRRRKVMLPTMAATSTASRSAGRRPHQGATPLDCSRMITV